MGSQKTLNIVKELARVLVVGEKFIINVLMVLQAHTNIVNIILTQI